MLLRPAAAQQEFPPVQRFQRLGDTLGGGRGRPIHASIGVEGGPGGGRGKAETDHHHQAGDELKHEAHAIISTFAGERNNTWFLRQWQACPETPLGKISQPIRGRCPWTAPRRLCFTQGKARFDDAVFPGAESNMSTITSEAVVLPRGSSPDRGPLLLWMIFTGLSIFAAVLLWR